MRMTENWRADTWSVLRHLPLWSSDRPAKRWQKNYDGFVEAGLAQQEIQIATARGCGVLLAKTGGR